MHVPGRLAAGNSAHGIPRTPVRKKEAAASRGETAANQKGRYVRVGGYFMPDRAASTESLTMNAVPHQSEPAPLGLIGVTLVVPVAV
jgi:hypothetical protein